MLDVHVRLKSNGDYWQAAWTDPRTRTPRGKSLGAKAKLSRRQAQAKIRQLALDLALGKKRDGKAPRLSAWVEQYKRLRTDVDPKTMRVIEHTGRYLEAFFDHDPTIDTITRAEAAEWRAALSRGDLRAKANHYPKPNEKIAAGTRYHGYRKRLATKLKEQKPKPLSESSVCKHVRAAKRMFNEATEEIGVGHIGANPFRRLVGKAPKPVKDWATITAADLTKILDACPGPGWRCLFALCRLAGLRRQEALDVRWVDVLWDENKLMVNASISRETTKRAPRVCPIEPARCPTGLLATLQAAFDEAAEGAVRACEGVSIDNLDKRARAIIAAAGIAPYAKPFHALRKNRAVELAAQYPQHVLTEWMGHDADVAETFYLRVDDSLYAPPPAQVAQIPAQPAPTPAKSSPRIRS